MPAFDKVSVLRSPVHPFVVECLCDAHFAELMMFTLLFYCTCYGVSVTDVTACSLSCSKQTTYSMAMLE